MDYTSIAGPEVPSSADDGEIAKKNTNLVMLKADPQLAKVHTQALSRADASSVILHPRCLRTSALDGQVWLPWPGSQPRFRLHEPGADEEQLLQGLPSMLEAGWADCSTAYVKEKCIKMLKYLTSFCVSILHTEVSHPFAP
eukprot:symbB.v1.2.023860.t1/scaffold2217.1/size85520/7